MGFAASLSAFEGPLDLLLHLIEKNKIDIYDIPISEVTDQYLRFLTEAEETDADIMSEFLVMAATLLDIKAKLLLPKEEEDTQEDPREELVQRLLEYKLYKYMSAELKDKQLDASKNIYRAPSVPDEVLAYRPPVDLDEFLGDTTLEKLKAVFDDVMARSAGRVNEAVIGYGTIKKEEVKIPDRIKHIQNALKESKKINFRTLLEEGSGKMNIIVTFLAVLELMKTGELKAEQDVKGELVLFCTEGNLNEEVSGGDSPAGRAGKRWQCTKL